MLLVLFGSVVSLRVNPLPKQIDEGSLKKKINPNSLMLSELPPVPTVGYL